MSIHTTTNKNSGFNGIDLRAANALVASGILSEGDIDNALEGSREYELLCIAHPTEEDRNLHRNNECDGACLRFRCFR